MGFRNRKGVLRSLLISILGYGGDVLYALRAAIFGLAQGARAVINPDYAKKIRDEMDP